MTEIIRPTDDILAKKRMENAAADALHLISNSSIVAALMHVDVISRKLYLLVREAMLTELTHRWEIEDTAAVFNLLTEAAHEKAVQVQVNPNDLRAEILQVLLPTVEIMCQTWRPPEEVEGEKVDDGYSESSTAVFSGDHDEATGGLGDKTSATGSDAVEEAGQRGEGSGGEDGGA